jgi:hypothetical protein
MSTQAASCSVEYCNYLNSRFMVLEMLMLKNTWVVSTAAIVLHKQSRLLCHRKSLNERISTLPTDAASQLDVLIN